MLGATLLLLDACRSLQLPVFKTFCFIFSQPYTAEQRDYFGGTFSRRQIAEEAKAGRQARGAGGPSSQGCPSSKRQTAAGPGCYCCVVGAARVFGCEEKWGRDPLSFEVGVSCLTCSQGGRYCHRDADSR